MPHMDYAGTCMINHIKILKMTPNALLLLKLPEYMYASKVALLDKHFPVFMF